MEQFEIKCADCGSPVAFEISEVPELGQYIDDRVTDATEDAQGDQSVAQPCVPDPRVFHDLSSAISRGDQDEARYQFDLIVAELGYEYQHAAEVGRFARAA